MKRHATFVRVALPASSVLRAARFYEGAFGWTFEPQPSSQPEERSAARTLCFLGSGGPGEDGWIDIAPEVALVEVEDVPLPGGVGASIGVDSIDRAFERIERAGGRPVYGPEVIDDIRTAMFADSEGNEIGLWSPCPEADFSWRPHKGAAVVDGATFQYVELEAVDLSRAADFYGGVFGWRFTPPHESHAPGGPVPSARAALYGHDVILYCNDTRPEVGLVKVDRIAPSAAIGLAIGVDSIPAAFDRLEKAGGSLLGRQSELGDLSVAMFADTEGNRVSLLAPGPGRHVSWRPHALESGLQT